jgi:hypothetical protein
MMPAVAYRLWAKYKDGLDWDIHDRMRRIKPMLFLLIFLAIATVVAGVIEPKLLSLLVIFLAWFIGFFIITAGWTKISGHTGGDALATGMVVASYGWQWWPILLIVPVVAWARVVRGDHTIFQVCLGAAYSWILLFAVSLLGY